MKITIPSFGLSKTGGDRVITSIANNLAQRGHEVRIVSLGKKPIPFELSKKVNLKQIPFNINKNQLWDFIIKGINKLANHLPVSDIYLANWVYTVLPCIVNNDRGRTVFLAQANEARDDFKEKSFKILQGISYEAYKLNIPIVTPSSYLQESILKRFKNRSIIIPPFVNGKLFKPQKVKKNNKLKILFVGNILKVNKGFDLLLKACLKFKKINFELHIATQADFKIKDKRINFLTIHKPKNDQELSDIYRNCNVFFNLSKEEGFGLTLLEAMTSGLVCIATNSGGIKDFAIHNKNCLIIERHSKAIVSILNKINKKGIEYFKNKLVVEAIKSANIYTEKKMIDSFEKLFQDVVKK